MRANGLLTSLSFSPVRTVVKDNKDGSYHVSYTPKEPGVYTVWVCIREQHVQVRKALCLLSAQLSQGQLLKGGSNCPLLFLVDTAQILRLSVTVLTLLPLSPTGSYTAFYSSPG